MNDKYKTNSRLFAFGATGLILILLYALATGKVTHERAADIQPVRHDTILSGMHYAIFTEARTGDVYVVNITLDSLRAIMFNKQIK